MLVLEAAAAPEHRPCGEFLGPDGVRILARAGLEAAVEAAGAKRLSGLSLHAPRGVLGSAFAPVAGLCPPSDHALGVRRERFDRCLQDAASESGAELRRGARVDDLSRDGDGWMLSTRDGARITTGMLVGADGRRSQVRHRAGLDLPVRRKRFALVCRASGILPRHPDRVHPGDPMGEHGEMHLGPLGQIGLAPLGDGEVNLNLLLAETSRPLLRDRSPGHVLRAGLMATPSLRERCRRAHLGPVMATGSLPSASRAVIADGVALAGDAAGFCDPFTGDGMCFALGGAELLAGCLTRLDLRAGIGPNALAPYARAWRARFGAKRGMAGGLHHLLSRRLLAETVVGLLGSSKTLGRLMVAFNGDYTLP